MTSTYRWPAALVALLAIALAGCAPPPTDPEPEPRFATEAEAFAAAEKTYRAYVDALNEVDLSDPETFEAVYAWTTGDLYASDRRGLTRYHADSARVSGASKVASIQPIEAAGGGSVRLAVCLDVSAVQVHDRSGNSLVAEDRIQLQSLTVDLLPHKSSTGLAIASIGPREGEPKCAG